MVLGEKQVALSGPSVGHTPDVAEVKSSRLPNDHSTLGPFLRRHVNEGVLFQMRSVLMTL